MDEKDFLRELQSPTSRAQTCWDDSMDVLIVGSLAYDSLETMGSREDELGGPASTEASRQPTIANGGNGVALVGVVGQDFKSEHLEWYRNSGLEISGIEENEEEHSLERLLSWGYG